MWPQGFKPISRINGTALTDFFPGTYGKGADYANGDGSFTYPGAEGPIASIRLANIADGIEDWELFNRLGHRAAPMIANADDLITQLVSNMTERVEDPGLLERVRRQAAHRIMAQALALKSDDSDDDDDNAQPGSSRKPLHIVHIVADDFGWAAVQHHRAAGDTDVRTPNRGPGRIEWSLRVRGLPFC